MRVEHEYARRGAWAYLAGFDVHRAKVFGRWEVITSIAPFEQLVDQVMSQPPYNTARRVLWVMDNGSSHGGQALVLDGVESREAVLDEKVADLVVGGTWFEVAKQ